MNIKKVKKIIFSLCVIYGILFMASGIVEVILGFCSILNIAIKIPIFSGDAFGGLALISIGITYILGAKKALMEDIRSISYLFTASLIGLGVGIVALLLSISNFIGLYLGFKNISLMSIYLILGVLSVIPYKVAKMISD